MTDYHWVYLLDEQFRVNRLSEQKNVSPDMVPADRTVLCIELSLWKDEPLWQASDEEIYRAGATRPDEDGLRRDAKPRSRSITSPTFPPRIRSTSSTSRTT